LQIIKKVKEMAGKSFQEEKAGPTLLRGIKNA
jgi:hypothetical protein